MSFYLLLWLSVPLAAVLALVMIALRSTAARERAWHAGRRSGIRAAAVLLLPVATPAPDLAQLISVKLAPLQAAMEPEDFNGIHRALDQRSKGICHDLHLPL